MTHRRRQDRQGPLLRAARSASASTTRVVRRSARCGSRSSRANQVVRLDARTGRPIGNPIKLPCPPERRRGVRGRDLGRRSSPATTQPDQLRQDRPARRARSARQRRLPVRDHVDDDEPDRALGRRPPPRADPARRPEDRRRSSSRSGSAATAARTSSTAAAALWIATPEDNAVYKVSTATGDADPDQRRPAPAPARGQPRHAST